MRISFEGVCTIGRAAELRERMLEALQTGESLSLDFQAVEDMDLSFCQLIHALRLSCKELGRSCELLMNLPEDLAGAADKGGLPELVRSKHADDTSRCAEVAR